jgi:hypothetical protein
VRATVWLTTPLTLRAMVPGGAAAVATLIRAASAAQPGFVETTREAHPGYAEPTFVNLQKRLAQ